MRLKSDELDEERKRQGGAMNQEESNNFLFSSIGGWRMEKEARSVERGEEKVVEQHEHQHRQHQQEKRSNEEVQQGARGKKVVRLKPQVCVNKCLCV